MQTIVPGTISILCSIYLPSIYGSEQGIDRICCTQSWTRDLEHFEIIITLHNIAQVFANARSLVCNFFPFLQSSLASLASPLYTNMYVARDEREEEESLQRAGRK